MTSRLICLIFLALCFKEIAGAAILDPCTDVSECPTNAICETFGCRNQVCICESGYRASNNGKECERVLNYNTTCGDPGTTCGQMSCVDSICNCTFDKGVHHDEKRCVQKPLGDTNFALLGDECGGQTVCFDALTQICNSTCECKTGFKARSDDILSALPSAPECVPDDLDIGTRIDPNLCYAPQTIDPVPIGGECQFDEDCPGNSTCSSVGCQKKCQCPENNLPNADKTKCLTIALLGDPCTPDTHMCATIKSVCRNDKCVCDESVSEPTPENLCREKSQVPALYRFATINETCAGITECEDGLVCTDEKCGCRTNFKEATVEERILHNPDKYCIHSALKSTFTQAEFDNLCVEPEDPVSPPSSVAEELSSTASSPEPSVFAIASSSPSVPATESVPPQVSAAESLPIQTSATESLTSEVSATELLPPQVFATESLLPQVSATESLPPQVSATESLLPQVFATESLLPQVFTTESLPPQVSATESLLPQVFTTESLPPQVSATESSLVPSADVSVAPSVSASSIAPPPSPSSSVIVAPPSSPSIVQDAQSTSMSVPIIPSSTEPPAASQTSSTVPPLSSSQPPQTSSSETPSPLPSSSPLVQTSSVSTDASSSLSPSQMSSSSPVSEQTESLSSSPSGIVSSSSASSPASSISISSSIQPSSTADVMSSSATVAPATLLGLGEVCGTQEECPANAECVRVDCEAFRCQCKANYSVDSTNKLCLRSVKLHETCDSTMVCSSPGSFCSTDNECICSGATPDETSDGNFCVEPGKVLLNEACVKNEQCIGVFGLCDLTSGKCVCDPDIGREATPEEIAEEPEDWQFIGQCRPAAKPTPAPSSTGTGVSEQECPDLVPGDFCIDTAQCPNNSACIAVEGFPGKQCSCNVGYTPDGSLCVPQKPLVPGDSCTDTAQCPNNSACIPVQGTCSKRCWCNVGYAPDQRIPTKCVPVVILGEPCKDGEQRCRGIGIYCKSGVCTCRTPSYEPSDNKRLCRPAGRTYIKYAMLNEACDRTAYPPILCAIKSELECKDGTCQCRGGYREATENDLDASYFHISQCRNTSMTEGEMFPIKCNDSPIPLVQDPRDELSEEESEIASAARTQTVVLVVVPSVLVVCIVAAAYTILRYKRRRLLQQNLADDVTSVSSEGSSRLGFQIPRPSVKLFRGDRNWSCQDTAYQNPTFTGHS